MDDSEENRDQSVDRREVDRETEGAGEKKVDGPQRNIIYWFITIIFSSSRVSGQNVFLMVY